MRGNRIRGSIDMDELLPEPPPNIDEAHEKEAERMGEELRTWEECYQRFKPEFDKIADYEKRIAELEEEIERRNRWKIDLGEDKTTIVSMTVGFAIATLFFVKFISGSGNVWLFFIAGLLIGVGWATILRLWVTRKG
jgi:hypothetical protein